METTTQKQQKNISSGWNRYAYAAFVLLGIYFLIIQKDLSSFVSNAGIALVFDPFDQQTSFSKRPLWQRIWLLVHVAVVLAVFIWMLL